MRIDPTTKALPQSFVVALYTRLKETINKYPHNNLRLSCHEIYYAKDHKGFQCKLLYSDKFQYLFEYVSGVFTETRTMNGERPIIKEEILISNIETWLSGILNQENIESTYFRLLNGEDLTEEGKIHINHNIFSNIELEILYNKLTELQVDLFKTQGLSQEAFSELKSILDELKINAETAPKNIFRENTFGKLIIKGYEHFGDRVYKNFIGKIMSEISNIFEGTIYNEIAGEIKKNLLSD